jgi:hypothetical protein
VDLVAEAEGLPLRKLEARETLLLLLRHREIAAVPTIQMIHFPPVAAAVLALQGKLLRLGDKAATAAQDLHH